MGGTTAKYSREYRQTPDGKAKESAYNISAKGIARKARYEASTKGKAGISRRRKANNSKVTALIVAAKSKPCMDCGGKFPPYCMDFHHANGDKSMNIGRSRHYGHAILAAEMAKCIVICANCHRIRHHGKPKN